MLFLCFAVGSSLHLEALERDYNYYGSELFQQQSHSGKKNYEYITDEVCRHCFIHSYGCPKQLDQEEIEIIPNLSQECTNSLCIACGEWPFYAGYLHFTYRNDYPFLKRQICFLKKYPNIDAYWPETSLTAREISELGVQKFKALLENTALEHFLKFSSYRKKFVVNSPYLDKLNKEIIPRSFVTTCFWFSDYYQVLEDLRFYAKCNLSVSNQDLVNENIEEILDLLSDKFIKTYEHQQDLFVTPEISQEIDLIKYLNGAWNSEEVSDDENVKGDIAEEQPKWFRALFHLVKGQAYNQALLYQDAVAELSIAIELKPESPDAYIERAYAYFELQQIDLAVDDYKTAKGMKFINDEFPKNLIKILEIGPTAWSDQGGYVVINYGALATAFCSGVIEGGKVSTIEFVPNTLGTLTGIGQGLWAFACSPNKVSKQFLDNMYYLVKYIKTHSSTELFVTMIPELSELIEEWDTITNSEKSHRIGYIVGKYGVDIFAPCACMKGIKRYQEIRHANAMLTLEYCLTKEKRVKILEEVAKRDAWRRNLFQNGKIQVHWGRQNKHIPGSQNYDPIRSSLTIGEDKLKTILKDNIGKGQRVIGDVPYSPGYKERAFFGEIIGEYSVLDCNNNLLYKIPTDKGIIIYSKYGIHLVPSNPKAKLK